VLPVFERLGDVESKAVVMARIADVLSARGETEEALRIYHEEVLPVFERLGDAQATIDCRIKLSRELIRRGQAGDRSEARAHLETARGEAERLRLRGSAVIKDLLESLRDE
jgi:hypothetical protein